MTKLKLTSALVAALAVSAPVFAAENTPAKSEAIIPQTGEVTPQAMANGEAPVETNARKQATAVESDPNVSIAKSDNDAKFSAVTPGVDKDTIDEDDTEGMVPTRNAGSEEMIDGESTENAKFDSVTPDTTLSGSEGEQTDNARLDAVTPETELQGSASVEIDNARYDAVTPEDKAKMSADASLEGVRVYDANNNWIGEVSKAQADKVVIDVGGFLGIGEKPVLLDVSQLAILKERDGDDFRVYTKMTEAEFEALPTYSN